MQNSPQVALSIIDELTEAETADRTEVLDWKDRALEALKKATGPLHPKELALATGVSVCKASTRAKIFYRTFIITYEGARTGRDRAKPVAGIDLHPDLRRFAAYDKASY